MSRRLLRLEIPIFPERQLFRIHDPLADLDGLGVAPVHSPESLISTSRDQLIVSCAQEHLGIQLTVEEWDAAPPPFSDGFEDEAKCVLYLRGQLSIDTGLSDSAVEALRLSGGVGDYGARLYTRNRVAARTSYAELYQQFADPLSDEFQQARKQLEGMEQYLLQLWRES